jgi:hypothetical protein
MSKFEHFIGIDVSKDHFDAVLILNGEKDKPLYNQFIKRPQGMKSIS